MAHQDYRRLLRLYQPIGENTINLPKLFKTSLESQNTTLEELRIANRELKEQNQASVDYCQQLEAECQRYKELFNLTPNGYLVTNANGTIQEANVAMATMLQVSQECLIGKPLLLFFPEPDRPYIRTTLTQLSQHRLPPIYTWETQLQLCHGNLAAVDMTLTCIYQSSGAISHILWLLRDITQQKEAEAKIHHQAFYDPLTNLPNRALLDTYLPKTLSQAQRQNIPVAIAFLDLDRFKVINDTLGHSVGDELLQQFGQRLQNCLRAEDLLVRWGGDEFIIVLAFVSTLDDVRSMCDRLIASVQPTFYINHHSLHISTSIGVTFYPDHGTDPKTLLRHADQALYQAKKRGGNTYYFYSANQLIS